MTEARAIRANFSDWRTVKSRKSLQLIFEVPLEQQADVLKMLGAPIPDSPQWCGIALLQDPNMEPKQSDPDKSALAQTRYRGLPPMKQAAQRSAMLCTDKQFHIWLVRKFGINFPMGHDHAVIAANWMRRYLGAESRSEIGMDDEVYRKFVALETDYKQAIGLMAEQRG